MFYYSLYLTIGSLFFAHSITSDKAKNYDKIRAFVQENPIGSFVITFVLVHFFPVFLLMRIKNT